MNQTVAVDFDGVIHAYSRGWGDGTIYDDPVPGAFDALRELMKTYAVFVHTSRDPNQVAAWLHVHSRIPTTVDTDAGTPTFWNDQTVVLVTNRKLPAIAYIDDRAIRFWSWPQTLADLANIAEAQP